MNKTIAITGTKSTNQIRTIIDHATATITYEVEHVIEIAGKKITSRPEKVVVAIGEKHLTAVNGLAALGEVNINA